MVLELVTDKLVKNADSSGKECYRERPEHKQTGVATDWLSCITPPPHPTTPSLPPSTRLLGGDFSALDICIDRYMQNIKDLRCWW